MSYFTPNKMAIRRKLENRFSKNVEKLKFSRMARGNIKWYSCCGKASGFLKKLNIELPYDPTIPLLGIYLKEFQEETQTDTCTPMFTAALFTTAKRWKQPKCPLPN